MTRRTTIFLVLFLIYAALGALIAFSIWMGHSDLSHYLLKGTIITTVLLVSASLLQKITTFLLTKVETGHQPWQQKWRSHLGLKKDERIIEILWFRMILYLVIWITFIISVSQTWGVENRFLEKININPLRILSGAIVFIAFALFTRYLRNYISKKADWEMGHGNRESLASIVGYGGFIIAFVIGADLAGIDFSGLAIIAGALSVGIGFGLKNIVNNFVSGMILLIERPIKAGDRIMVGDVEGHVSRISIRSTHISTLQKADVIIPNSDLLSKPVINYTLYDHNSRIAINVKVAYGTDLRLVESILKKIANSHPEVILDKEGQEPDVYFKNFGDNGIEFELNCSIKNINLKSNVINDLNFSIEEAFRTHNIVIPFLQRDIQRLYEGMK